MEWKDGEQAESAAAGATTSQKVADKKAPDLKTGPGAFRAETILRWKRDH